MQKLTIVKVGGKLLDHKEKLSETLVSFAKTDGLKILVHGGGQKSSELSERLGIAPQIVEGRRITDDRTLEIVVMVYAGLLNKTVVSQLQSIGCDAIGLTGADGNTILAKKRKVGHINFGFAGDIEKIYTPFISNLLSDGLTPVFCAITHNGKGQLLNTNADTIATSLASAFAKDYEITLKYCFEKKGVLFEQTDDLSVIRKLSKKEYIKYKEKGIINEGMVPKLDNAFAAKKALVSHVYICGPNGLTEDALWKGTEICS